MKIAIAQINPTVGHLESNCQIIIDFCHKAQALNADLVIFPELSLLGYPPKDLLLRKDFIDSLAYFHEKIANSTSIASIIGSVIKDEEHKLSYNVALLCHQGRVEVVGKKILLPNYNVFDEKRYFESPTEKSCQAFTFNGKKMLVSICEDAWNSHQDLEKKYDFDPIALGVKKHGPIDYLINICASPFTKEKPYIREQIFTNLAKTYGCPVLVSAQVGANDQLLFDGNSMAIDKNGQVKRAKSFKEDLIFFDSDESIISSPPLDKDFLLCDALVMGIKDYVNKCGAKGLILGLSGGIDSAVCLSLCVKALGKDRVRAIYLPSRFSSPRSLNDASKLANDLGIKLEQLDIESSVEQIRNLLGPMANNSLADIADQNLQARMRGLIVMALANLADYLMVATSNKSELSVGYGTLYGDMCGAFSPIGDLYKAEVYRVAKTLGIPDEIIKREPSAELKADQLDSDSLPEYEVLDKILFNFIDLDKSLAEIVEITGFDKTLIQEVIAMVNRSEFKRRQGPFPLMVSDKVFGDARRMPLAKRL